MIVDAVCTQIVVWPKWAIIAGAYIFATVIAHFPIHWAVAEMWKIVEIDTDKRHEVYGWQTGPLGMIERALYVVALGLLRPEFIAVWLTLKTVTKSPRWSLNPGRHIFNIFLVGNGLSILFALAAAGVVSWVTGYSWERLDCLPMAAPLALFGVALLLCVYLWVIRIRKNDLLRRARG